MMSDPDQTIAHQIVVVINEWRARVLNVEMVMMVLVALPIFVAALFGAAGDSRQLPAMLVYFFIYILTIALTFLRRIDHRIRGWGLLLLIYMIGVIALARG